MEKQLAALREKETVLTTALNEEDAKVKTVEDEMYGEKQHIDTEWEKIHKREAELQDDIVRKCITLFMVARLYITSSLHCKEFALPLVFLLSKIIVEVLLYIYP